MLYIIRKIVQVTNCEIMHGQDPPFKEIKGGLHFGEEGKKKRWCKSFGEIWCILGIY